MRRDRPLSNSAVLKIIAGLFIGVAVIWPAHNPPLATETVRSNREAVVDKRNGASDRTREPASGLIGSSTDDTNTRIIQELPKRGHPRNTGGGPPAYDPHGHKGE